MSIRAMPRRNGLHAGRRVPKCWSGNWRQGDKVADSYTLITGGSSGIGAATCRTLVAAGHQVISLDLQGADTPVPGVREVLVDLTDAAATTQVARDLARQLQITTVIHNAGAVRERPLEQVTAEDLAALTNLHVAAAVSL